MIDDFYPDKIIDFDEGKTYWLFDFESIWLLFKVLELEFLIPLLTKVLKFSERVEKVNFFAIVLRLSIVILLKELNFLILSKLVLIFLFNLFLTIKAKVYEILYATFSFLWTF